MTAFRGFLVTGFALAAFLLVSCESVGDLVGSGDGDGPRSLLGSPSADSDNSVKFTIQPGKQTTAWFLFSVDAPEAGRIRVKISDPGSWLPTSGETPLSEIESRRDGTFPKAASLPVDDELTVRVIVEYQDEGGRWQRMGLLYPVSDPQWKQLAPPGAKETGMIRWAIHGDPMNGSVGVKVRADE